MVSRTLTEADSKLFSALFAKHFGVFCAGNDGSTYSYCLWYHGKNKNSENYYSQIYARSTAGAYTLSAKSGWKVISISPNQLNVRIPCSDGTNFKWRGNCNDTNPDGLPTECNKTCSLTNTGASSVINACIKFLIPSSENESVVKAWINKVVNSTVSISDATFPISRTKHEQRYVYLNDLMQHKQPFGPTSRRK